MKEKIKSRHEPEKRIIDGWDDIPDLCIPTVFIKKMMSFVNGLYDGDVYEPEAFDKVKVLFLALFPHISRHLGEEDKEKVKGLMGIPSYLGGMG